MQFPTLLPLTTLLLLSSSTTALPKGSPVHPIYPWVVTNYTEGCSPAACVYTFNITYTPPAHSHPPPSPFASEPAFTTTCTGNNLATSFQACTDPSVSTLEVNGWSNVTLIVQHVYTQKLEGNAGGEARYTVKGNHTIVNPGYKAYDFVVVQSEISAVA